jgi:hypothetical protein
LIACAASWFRSNVAILALVLPADSWACIAARAIGAPSVTMLVMEASCASFDWMVCCTDGRSAPLTWRFSVLG